MTPRNWAAFFQAQRTRQNRAEAEGAHRPPPLITSEDDPTVLNQQDQDDEQIEDPERD